MFKIQIISIKQQDTTEFFISDDDIHNYIDEVYIKSNLILSYNTTISDDNMKSITVIEFDSEKSWEIFSQDPILVYHNKIKMRYNNYHRIGVSTGIDGTTTKKNLSIIYNDGKLR